MIIDKAPRYLAKEHSIRIDEDSREVCRFPKEYPNNPLVKLVIALREKTPLTASVDWWWDAGTIGNTITLLGEKEDWVFLKNLVNTLCVDDDDQTVILERFIYREKPHDTPHYRFSIKLGGGWEQQEETLKRIKELL